MSRMQPLHLPSNQFDHFYRGGDRIGALRGGPGGPQRPEEWIGSVTTRFGESVQGLSSLPDGTTLRAAVAADPLAWLGPEHIDRYGSDGVQVLVKLLDPDQRLPVHVHPRRDFAGEHLGSLHGKTEAWIVVDRDPGALVGLGFRREMELDEIAGFVAAHDSDALLDLMLTRTVEPGDGILVPAGTPHFISAGIFIVELQEPTDFSILLEWDGLAIDGDVDGHLGLGFDVALQAVDRSAWSSQRADEYVVRRGASSLARRSALPSAARAYFRADTMEPGDGPVTIDAGFAIVLLLEGAGELRTADGELPVRRGDAVLVPWAAGDWTLSGPHIGGPKAILCRPPAPGAPPATW